MLNNGYLQDERYEPRHQLSPQCLESKSVKRTANKNNKLNL
jgi:hypothetical protein